MPRSKKPVSQRQLTAAGFAVLRIEDLQAVARLKAGLVAVFQPLNAQELFALERIARAQNRNYALAEGFHRMGRGFREAESPAR